jgi:transposase-like protein
MGILDSLFGKKKDAATAAVEEKPIEEECPHGSMTPHWDNAADLGKADLISSYVCEGCGKTFSKEEGERVMAHAADVVKIDEDLRKTTEEMVEEEQKE